MNLDVEKEYFDDLVEVGIKCTRNLLISDKITMTGPGMGGAPINYRAGCSGWKMGRIRLHIVPH